MLIQHMHYQLMHCRVKIEVEGLSGTQQDDHNRYVLEFETMVGEEQ